MSNPWLRLYHEFSTDPKIQMLSEADQRRFIMILCLRCCNGNVTLHDDEVSFQLRITIAEWKKTKATLLSKNLICSDNSPTNWDKRQYVSDSSAARVARHRERKKQACNVTVTPPDTDTDTDTDTDADNIFPDGLFEKPHPEEKAKSETEKHFQIAWSHYPSRSGGNSETNARKAFAARIKSGIDPQELIQGVIRYAAWCDSNAKTGTEFVKQAATFFGPGLHFKEPFTIPTDPAQPGGRKHAPKSKSFDIRSKLYPASPIVDSANGPGHGASQHPILEARSDLPESVD